MTLNENYEQKEALLSFVNNVAELILDPEEYLDPNTKEIMMLGIEEDSNIMDPECSSKIENIESYLDVVFEELKDKLNTKLSHSDKVMLIDQDEETIAWKVWTKEDVKQRLIHMKDNGYIKCEVTDELVDEVSSNVRGLNDCTDDDWQIIDNAIMDAIKE